MNKYYSAMLACFLIGPAASYSAERMLWPDEGHFLAYPAEPRTDVLQWSAFAGVSRDSNLFRLSDDTDPQIAIGSTDKADTVGRIGLGLNADIPVSRQRYIFNASVDYNSFKRFDFLDYWGYRLGADWKWQAGNQWNGDLAYARNHSLADLAELQGLVKDLITQDYATASANYKFHPSWRVRGGLDGYKYDHSNDSQTTLNNRTVSGTVGVDYVTAAENTAGLQFKASDGNYPNRQVVAGSTVDNNYREYETSAVVGWQFAGKTRFDGRLGHTNRRHDQISERDYSGSTGRAGLKYIPSAKTLVELAAYREIHAVEELTASYVLAKGITFGPAWAPTAKSVLQARYIYEKRDFQGDPGFVLGANPRREDTARTIRVAAGYKPLRNTDLALVYEHGKRSSNLPDVPFNYNLVSLNGAFNF